jgi:hypothetical protein
MLSLFYNSTLAICSDAKYETISELRIHIKQSYFIHKKMWKNSKNNFDNTRQGSPKIIKFVHSYPECYYYYMIYLSIYTLVLNLGQNLQVKDQMGLRKNWFN